MDGAHHRGLGRLHRRIWCATTRGGKQPDPLRRPRRRQPLGHHATRPPTRPGRPTTPRAATASTRAAVSAAGAVLERHGPRLPGNPQGYKGAFAVSYNRPWSHRSIDRRTSESWLFIRRVPDDPVPRGARVRRHATPAGPTSTPTARSCSTTRSSSPRARRVLVGRPAGQRHERPRPRREPGLLQRQRDLLEDALGRQHRRLQHALPDAHHLQGDPLQRADRPRGPGTWTGSWADPRFSPPADGDNPGNSLTGQYFAVNAGTTDITVPSQYSKLRCLAQHGGGQARLRAVRHARRRRRHLGYEWDIDADNGFRPAGEIDLSSTTELNGADRSSTTTAPTWSPADGHPSPDAVQGGQRGAGLRRRHRPVGPGGLASSDNPEPAHAPDPNMEQSTVNLSRRMGAQPATLISGLVPGSPSTDTTPPTSTITSPAPGATLHRRRPGHHHRDRDRRRRRRRGRRRGLDRRRQHLAPGDPHARRQHDRDPGPTRGPPTATRPTTIESRAADDSGNTRDARPMPRRSTSTARARIWGTGVTPDRHRLGDAARRSRSGSSSPPTCTERSPGSGSTSRRPTPGPTSETSGRPPASCWRRPRSPTRRRRAGRR